MNSTIEEPPDLERFTHAEAWIVGRDLVERCPRDGLPVAISIVLGSQRVFGLPETQYAAAGGAVPARVRGALVGVLAVSGLDSESDHQLALDALTALAAKRGSGLVPSVSAPLLDGVAQGAGPPEEVRRA